MIRPTRGSAINIREYRVNDVGRLEALAPSARGAKQRDRARIALLVMRGWGARETAQTLSSNRGTVQA